MNSMTITKPFHGYSEAELGFKPGSVVGAKETERFTKHFIIQEREIGYRFYLHQHPYVQQLVKRLLRNGTAGLQAADTMYTPNGVALPRSIDIALNKNAGLSIPGSSWVQLLSEVKATAAGATPISLPANMQLKTASAAQATLPDGMFVSLFDSMTGTPSAGTVFSLSQDMGAMVGRDTKIALASAAQITLHDGTQAEISAGVEILLLRNSRLTIPKGMQATILRSKPKPELYEDFFNDQYKPSDLVQQAHPVKDLDFTSSGAYSVYNWELFFHVPLTIAIHLSRNQRFAEAQRWFHYLFDPTDNSEGPTPERFWRVRPFQYTDVKKIEEILVNLATGADPTLRNETISSIEAWKASPFRPHVVARYRQQAYMYKTVMAYLDNLIAWGDSLFRQDTGESIDEALMLYVLAANILGPRPQPVPKKGAVRPQTYANLRADLDQFGNAMRDMEADIPFDLMPFPADGETDNDRLATLRSLGKALYFCVPRNDNLMSYWDTVADRLFKIRNSLNIQGIFRQLALFEPPIDPAMLARAAAAGLDVGAVVSGLNQPLPLVRFQLLVQKAAEICQEVKSLGNNLLSAMEKEDGEALAILRAKHERIVMEMVEHVKYAQWQEAIKSREGLLKSLALAVQRYTYYEQQLGKKLQSDDPTEKIIIPDLGELDKDSLEKMNLTTYEPEVGLREIEVDVAQDLNESGSKAVSSHEVQEMAKLKEARDRQVAAGEKDRIGAGLGLIPDFTPDVKFMGLGIGAVFGGSFLSRSMSFWASFGKADADKDTYEASNTAKIGTYARRVQDWAFQSNLAAGEITQIFKQIRAAEIRQAVAELELKNHRKQISHAQEIERFLNEEGSEKDGKKTNKALYAWMKREVKGLYGQCFQFAFDIAKKAERALQHELGNPELGFLEFGYLAGKEGLLAGEKLYLDIKRMEMAHHDLNQREYELTKQVSLLQVNPLALLQLRTTGRCTVTLPEELFDMDGPGHYFRRIKSVAVSIPCVAGPYSSVNCTLTLLKSSIRKTQVLRGDLYEREDAEDDRFSDYFSSLQSIVTSTGQNDSGLFETNLHDERYLPFEGSGAVSEWQLELPADVRQFDYDTIADVILHLRYTAREGGGLLRKRAVDNLNRRIGEAKAVGSVRLFSVRHEFPTEWAKFKSVQLDDTIPVASLTLDLRENHYPIWSKNRLKTVKQVDFYAKTPKDIGVFDQPTDQLTYTPPDPPGSSPVDVKKDPLVKDPSLKDLRAGKLENIALPPPTGKFTLYFDDNESIDDLWLALAWGE